MDSESKSNEVWIGGQTGPPEELSDYDIQMIHAGLLIPSEKAIHSMAREIRKRRGVPNPDSV
jgi:hypothetical protein